MPWPVAALNGIFYSFGAYMIVLLVNYFFWKIGWIHSSEQKKTPAAAGSLSNITILLSGKFSPRSKVPSWLSIIWTTASFLAVLDFVYRGDILHGDSPISFSRVGHVNETHAYIAVRSPTEGPIQIKYGTSDAAASNKWQLGQTLLTAADDDYMITFKLEGLTSNTQYRYKTNGSHSGFFRTPLQRPKQWSFVSSSCIKPMFPYSPLDHSLRIKGLEHLSGYLETAHVDFMLFLGDFIYVDLPKRFGFTPEHYRRLYRQVYASPSWSMTLKSLSWLHAYDDHEITNDWSANETGIYGDAIESYMNYQNPANPDPVISGGTYYTFQHGDVDFFVLDTRRYRSPASMPDGPSKTMLGARQRREVEEWLAKGTGWKVLVSSVPFTRNFRGPSSKDSWAGYLWEREELLKMMWKSRGVLIITGDRHEHATTAFPEPGSNRSHIIEFSTSPLNQFVQPQKQQLYSQIEESDMAIFYHPDGQSKFGIFSFDTSDDDVWQMKFDLLVDGEPTWSYKINQTRAI